MEPCCVDSEIRTLGLLLSPESAASCAGWPCADPGTDHTRMESITHRSPNAPIVKSSPIKPSSSRLHRTLLRVVPDALFRFACGNPRSTTGAVSAANTGRANSTEDTAVRSRFEMRINEPLPLILHE